MGSRNLLCLGEGTTRRTLTSTGAGHAPAAGAGRERHVPAGWAAAVAACVQVRGGRTAGPGSLPALRLPQWRSVDTLTAPTSTCLRAQWFPPLCMLGKGSGMGRMSATTITAHAHAGRGGGLLVGHQRLVHRRPCRRQGRHACHTWAGFRLPRCVQARCSRGWRPHAHPAGPPIGMGQGGSALVRRLLCSAGPPWQWRVQHTPCWRHGSSGQWVKPVLVSGPMCRRTSFLPHGPASTNPTGASSSLPQPAMPWGGLLWSIGWARWRRARVFKKGGSGCLYSSAASCLLPLMYLPEGQGEGRGKGRARLHECCQGPGQGRRGLSRCCHC